MDKDANLYLPTQVASISYNEETTVKQEEKESQGPILRSSSREASESTDDSAIDTNKMTEQLRVVYKEIAESRSEKDDAAELPGPRSVPHPSELDPKDNETYKKALACVPKLISGLGLECQVAISDVLNVERDDYKDYRLVADSLGLPTTSINVVEHMPNQMMQVFNQCGSKDGKDLIEALMKWGRFDAMEVVVKFFYERGSLSPSLSVDEVTKQIQRQRHLTGSLNESMLQGRLWRKPAVEEDTGHPRSSSLGTAVNPVQYDVTPHPTCHPTEDYDEWETEDFEFWSSIPGDHHFKKLKHVKKRFQKLHESNEKTNNNFGYIWKLIVHTLKLDYSSGDSQIVTAENFRRMLAFFGSPTNDENSCMGRAYDLMKRSMRIITISDEHLVLTWFAGHITPEDANDRLLQCKRGTFLVRFSTSAADQGWYVLTIRTESQGVSEFQIQQFHEQKQRKFRLDSAEGTFDNLPDLIEHYERVKDKDGDVSESLIRPCPNSPLHQIFKGYKSAPKKSKGKKK